MKKKILLLLALALFLGLTACDESNKNDIYIGHQDYINTTITWIINSYNGFIYVESDEQFNEDTQEYTVTLKFKNIKEG